MTPLVTFDPTDRYLAICLYNDATELEVAWESLDGMTEEEYIPEIGKILWKQISELPDTTIMKLTLSLRRYQEEKRLVYDSNFSCQETIAFLKREHHVETVEDLMSSIDKINRNYTPEEVYYPNTSLTACFEQIIVQAAVYCSRTLSEIAVQHYTRILPKLIQRRAFQRVTAAKRRVAQVLLDNAREHSERAKKSAERILTHRSLAELAEEIHYDEELSQQLVQNESERIGGPVILATSSDGRAEFLDCK